MAKGRAKANCKKKSPGNLVKLRSKVTQSSVANVNKSPPTGSMRLLHSSKSSDALELNNSAVTTKRKSDGKVEFDEIKSQKRAKLREKIAEKQTA